MGGLRMLTGRLRHLMLVVVRTLMPAVRTLTLMARMVMTVRVLVRVLVLRIRVAR